MKKITNKRITAQEIDAILPQTQCGLCSYAGCLPYAEALANDTAEINLCPPGGVPGLIKLANLLEKNPQPFIADMEKKAKPKQLAVIREEECIGCTKCIQACPVDAILGASKQMHTVLSYDCTGCELCIAPCPVDCIDLITLPGTIEPSESDRARKRYQSRQKRISSKNDHKKDIKADLIQAALLRAKRKNQ